MAQFGGGRTFKKWGRQVACQWGECAWRGYQDSDIFLTYPHSQDGMRWAASSAIYLVPWCTFSPQVQRQPWAESQEKLFLVIILKCFVTAADRWVVHQHSNCHYHHNSNKRKIHSLIHFHKLNLPISVLWSRITPRGLRSPLFLSSQCHFHLSYQCLQFWLFANKCACVRAVCVQVCMCGAHVRVGVYTGGGLRLMEGLTLDCSSLFNDTGSLNQTQSDLPWLDTGGSPHPLVVSLWFPLIVFEFI